MAGDIFQQVDVELDLVFNEGALNFDHYLCAVAKFSLIHLSNGGCCQRLGIKFGKDIVNRCSQLFFDQLERSVVVERFSLRLQFLELHPEPLRNHIGAIRYNLSELYKCGTQLFDGDPKTFWCGVSAFMGIIISFVTTATTTAIGEEFAQRMLEQDP